MKRKIIMVVTIVLLIVTNATFVFANEEPIVKLVVDKTEVKPGEEFTVTLKVSCKEGINGIDTTYSYDTEKLELVSTKILNSNFASLGVDNQITLINNSTESIQETDIYMITLKVKEDIGEKCTASIGISETFLDSDATTNSSHTIAKQEVKIIVNTEIGNEKKDEIIENDKDTDDKKNDENTQLPDDNKDDENTQVPDDNKDEKSDYTQSSESGKDITQSKSEETIIKDDTVSDKKIPKAGKCTKLMLAVFILIIIAIIITKKRTEYQDIN